MSGASSPVPDQWAAAASYENYMGRWSRELAPEFVRWLNLPDNLRWCEIGCGTGALTTAIVLQADPASVVACDPVEQFVAYARARQQHAQVLFAVANASNFPLCDGGYDSITSMLALNFFPDPRAALARMREVVAVGGVISACVWDYAEGMEFLRYFWDAALEVDGRARDYDEGTRFPICDPDPLRSLFADAQLVDVRCEPIEIGTEFTSFDDYWRPFLGSTGPAPSFVASLDEPTRTCLRQNLAASLPTLPDGRIRLRARAWAVRGRKAMS